MQKSKNPNQFPTIELHNTKVFTIKQLFQLEICLNGDARTGLHWGKEERGNTRCQLGLPLISIANEINTLTKYAT